MRDTQVPILQIARMDPDRRSATRQCGTKLSTKIRRADKAKPTKRCVLSYSELDGVCDP